MNSIQATSKERILAEYKVLSGRLSLEEQQMLGSLLLLNEPQGDCDEVQGHITSDYLVYQVAETYHRDLLDDAKAYRREHQAQSGRPSLWTRLTWSLGNFLVTTGRRLRGPAVPLASAN